MRDAYDMETVASATMVGVIGVGSPVVDFVAQIDEETLARVPGRKGGMELVDGAMIRQMLDTVGGLPVKSPGGSAGNTIFALARLGMPTAFMGKLGDDENGEFYRSIFNELGGDCTRFRNHVSAPTACCVSMVTPDGERTMRTDLGAAAGFSPEDVTADDFAGCRHAHVEGYLLFNRELLSSVLRSARAAGCTVSMDLGSFEVVQQAADILPDVLANYVDVVFANEAEAEAFSGQSDPEKGLAALARLCDVAAVKVGADGAYLQNGGAAIHVPAAPADRVMDTTGAGDFWAAGFLFGHLNGYSLATSGMLGSLLGKHIIADMGTALPPRRWDRIIADTTVLLKNMKEEKCS